MTAGRSGVLWNGPAVCGTVARGNLSMMRLLVELEANLNGRLVSFNGEPNVTLLYDASYFGILAQHFSCDASYLLVCMN
eukprot:Skav209918  [mRNA]  locus=scaffold1253:136516:136752:- [translate_table: standard]